MLHTRPLLPCFSLDFVNPNILAISLCVSRCAVALCSQERLRRKLQYMLYNLQESLWPSVQLAGLHGMQKLILFAPTFMRIPEFMPVLKVC